MRCFGRDEFLTHTSNDLPHSPCPVMLYLLTSIGTRYMSITHHQMHTKHSYTIHIVIKREIHCLTLGLLSPEWLLFEHNSRKPVAKWISRKNKTKQNKTVDSRKKKAELAAMTTKQVLTYTLPGYNAYEISWVNRILMSKQ